MLPPEKAAARLQTDVSRAPHQLRLPPELDKGGAGHWGLFKICVSVTGEVTSTHTLKSTGSAELDAAWSSTVRGWRYQPHTVGSAAVPFCYAARLQVGAATPKTASPQPLTVEPKAARLLSNVHEDPHKPRLPDHLNGAGAVIWGMYKVCVSAEGAVAGVSVLRSAGSTVLKKGDQQLVDARWMDTIKTWKYRPYMLGEKAVPFCYPLRLTVSAK
jgi:outer membrane biosynthesis protein TonB